MARPTENLIAVFRGYTDRLGCVAEGADHSTEIDQIPVDVCSETNPGAAIAQRALQTPSADGRRRDEAHSAHSGVLIALGLRVER